MLYCLYSTTYNESQHICIFHCIFKWYVNLWANMCMSVGVCCANSDTMFPGGMFWILAPGNNMAGKLRPRGSWAGIPLVYFNIGLRYPEVRETWEWGLLRNTWLHKSLIKWPSAAMSEFQDQTGTSIITTPRTVQTRRAFNLSFCIWWAPQALSISIGCAVFMIEVPKIQSQPNWYCTRWCHFPLLQLGWRCYVLDQNLMELKPTTFTLLHVGPPCVLDFCRFLLQLEICFHDFGHCTTYHHRIH